MSALSSKRNNSTQKKTIPASVADIIVRRSQHAKKKAPMLTADIVPAGSYRSTVIAVNDAMSTEGKPVAEVTYSFADSCGKIVEARVRYPLTGYRIQKLVDAWIDAGLPEKASLVDAVGIEEEVEVVYPYDGALGKIKTRFPADKAVKAGVRKPVAQKVSHRIVDDDADELFNGEEHEEFDEEFDDFIEEDIDD